MKWFLIAWGFSGAHVEGVFSSAALCNAVAQHEATVKRAAVRFCARLEVDNLVTDVVLYDFGSRQRRQVPPLQGRPSLESVPAMAGRSAQRPPTRRLAAVGSLTLYVQRRLQCISTR